MYTDTPRLLIEPNARRRILDAKEFWEYRDLLYFLVLRDITVVYKQTVLGFAWAIINPLVSMLIFSVIFGRMAQMPSDGIPYPIFSYVALIPWAYFAATITGASTSLVQGTAVFTKVYFPRVFIPLVPVISKLVDSAIGFLTLIALMLWYQIKPSPTLLYLPVVTALMIITSAGIGIGLAALAIQYRDVRHAIAFMVQILMYAAPVVWPVSLVPAKFRLIYGLYPMVGIVEGYRSAILGVRPMPWDLLAAGAVGASMMLFVGLRYFRNAERVFADIA